MTVKDFILECESYQYSQEYYDLMKESAEIELMEHYIESKEYLMENAEVLESTSFTESYFGEKVTKEDVDNLKKKLGDKTKGALSKAGKVLMKFLKGFIMILNKAKTILVKIFNEASKKVIKFIEETKDDAETRKNFASELRKAVEENKHLLGDYVILRFKEDKKGDITRNIRIGWMKQYNSDLDVWCMALMPGTVQISSRGESKVFFDPYRALSIQPSKMDEIELVDLVETLKPGIVKGKLDFWTQPKTIDKTVENLNAVLDALDRAIKHNSENTSYQKEINDLTIALPNTITAITNLIHFTQAVNSTMLKLAESRLFGGANKDNESSDK